MADPERILELEEALRQLCLTCDEVLRVNTPEFMEYLGERIAEVRGMLDERSMNADLYHLPDDLRRLLLAMMGTHDQQMAAHDVIMRELAESAERWSVLRETLIAEKRLLLEENARLRAVVDAAREVMRPPPPGPQAWAT